jgi:TonB family protein
MNNFSVYDELDQAIDQMLTAPEDASRETSIRDTNVGELLELASDLRHLPRTTFKMSLKLELEWEAAERTVTADADTQRQPACAATPESAGRQVLTSLFGKTGSMYPVRRANFAASVALHAVMLFLIGAGLVMVKSTAPRVDPHMGVSVRLEPYPLPAGSRESHGGGSGGANDKTRASEGIVPRAAREQLTPPIVLRNSQPRLMAEATVVAPPDLNFPRNSFIGNRLSDLTVPSNGPGVGGGMGGKKGGGIGDGDGPGHGDGINGGCCDGTYAVGNGVSMPRVIYAPEPEFSEEARKSKYQGDVVLLATIGADGRPRDLTVVRSLGMGLDEKALEKVRTWRFDPAKKDGHPVAVPMNIIVNFHLY